MTDDTILPTWEEAKRELTEQGVGGVIAAPDLDDSSLYTAHENVEKEYIEEEVEMPAGWEYVELDFGHGFRRKV